MLERLAIALLIAAFWSGAAATEVPADPIVAELPSEPSEDPLETGSTLELGSAPESGSGVRPASAGDPQATLPDVAARAGTAPPASGQAIWLGIDTPAENHRHQGAVAWTHLTGRAGVGRRVDYDVAIALDLSGSTAFASGSDVDGDGKVGKAKRRIDSWRSFNPRRMSNDPGDTILAAELLATRKLVESLSEQTTRLALIAFSDRAHLQSPLAGDHRETLAALDRLEGRYGGGMTNMADALRVGMKALLADGATSELRKPVLVVLSDGYPTFPGNERLAAEEARKAARELDDAGIEIITVGLGLAEHAEGDVYYEIAADTGGDHLRLDRPGDVVHALPGIEFASVPEIHIENATVGAPGRAPRITADGSFGAFVPLAPGRNLLRVQAIGDRGAKTRVERWLEYLPDVDADPVQREQDQLERAAFERALADRTVALQLTLEATERRATAEELRQRKQVDLEPGHATPSP